MHKEPTATAVGAVRALLQCTPLVLVVGVEGVEEGVVVAWPAVASQHRRW